MSRSRINADQANNIDGVPIGATTPSTGAFTALAASGAASLSGAVALLGTVSGAALTAYLASPPAIGGTAPAAATFTDLTSTGTTTALGGDILVRTQAPSTASATSTLSAASIAGGLINYTGAAAGTLTMPTAGNLDNKFLTMGVDQGVEFSVIVTVAFAVTMAGNTGVTFVGSLTVAANTSGRFRVRKSAASTYIVYRIA